MCGWLLEEPYEIKNADGKSRIKNPQQFRKQNLVNAQRNFIFVLDQDVGNDGFSCLPSAAVPERIASRTGRCLGNDVT